jgi:predicted RecB family nuclease
VAPYFGFHWHAEDAGGLNSEAWYKEWLGTGDGAILDKILRYNLDDVVAMEEIDRALRKWILASHA